MVWQARVLFQVVAFGADGFGIIHAEGGAASQRRWICAATFKRSVASWGRRSDGAMIAGSGARSTEFFEQLPHGDDRRFATPFIRTQNGSGMGSTIRW